MRLTLKPKLKAMFKCQRTEQSTILYLQVSEDNKAALDKTLRRMFDRYIAKGKRRQQIRWKAYQDKQRKRNRGRMLWMDLDAIPHQEPDDTLEILHRMYRYGIVPVYNPNRIVSTTR